MSTQERRYLHENILISFFKTMDSLLLTIVYLAAAF